MKKEKISEAMGNISSRHIKEAAEFTVEEKTHRNNNVWMKWMSIVACFALVCVIAFVGGNIISSDDVINSGIAMDKAVIDYGPFIFIPIIFVTIISLWVSFAKYTAKKILIANIISLVAINILNALVVFAYSQLGGINIFGNLPIILISSNMGAIISIVTITLFGRKTKTWWMKLLLWMIVSIVAIILACMVHNIFLALFQGNMITFA